MTVVKATCRRCGDSDRGVVGVMNHGLCQECERELNYAEKKFVGQKKGTRKDFVEKFRFLYYDEGTKAAIRAGWDEWEDV